MRILLVEDEFELGRSLSRYLRKLGYVVDLLDNCEDASLALRAASYSLLILDRRLPDGDGLSVLQTARRLGLTMPAIMLTAMDEIADRIVGLRDGADDYMVKPFDREELAARILAALRRGCVKPALSLNIGRLRYDPALKNLSGPQGLIVLARRELLLFASLAQRIGRVVPRATLIDEIYGFDDIVVPATLETHVSRLRARLVEERSGIEIHTLRGLGYMIDES
jgi:two-component system, OmpR family, response regulator